MQTEIGTCKWPRSLPLTLVQAAAGQVFHCTGVMLWPDGRIEFIWPDKSRTFGSEADLLAELKRLAPLMKAELEAQNSKLGTLQDVAGVLVCAALFAVWLFCY